MDNLPHIEIEGACSDVVINDAIDLRDHFAGLAMQGFLAHYGNNGTWDNLSEMSYQIADAMLKARKEVKP